jgi:hypothetical protein
MLKSKHINNIYSQLRINGLTVNPSPELNELALDRMEDVMAEFEDRGLCIGYRFEEKPDANSEAGITRSHNQMLHTNVAVRLIPDFNKQVPVKLEQIASATFKSALSTYMSENRVQTTPIFHLSGRTNRARYGGRYRVPVETKQQPSNCKVKNMIIGEVEDFSESFASYIDRQNNESIKSFTAETTEGLNLKPVSCGLTISPSEDAGLVTYRAEGVKSGCYVVTITITTSTGRIKTKKIDFVVADAS